MDLFRAQRGMLKQAFAQVCEVSVRVSVGGHTLVDLTYMHTRPRDIFPRRRPQHDPGSVTATDRQGKPATSSNRRASIRGDCRRGRSRDGIGVIKHFDIHSAASPQPKNPTAVSHVRRTPKRMKMRSRRPRGMAKQCGSSDNEYPYTIQSVTGETPVLRWLRAMAVPAMTELDRFVNLVSTNWTWLPHPVFSRQSPMRRGALKRMKMGVLWYRRLRWTKVVLSVMLTARETV